MVTGRKRTDPPKQEGFVSALRNLLVDRLLWSLLFTLIDAKADGKYYCIVQRG